MTANGVTGDYWPQARTGDHANAVNVEDSLFSLRVLGSSTS